MSRPNVPAFSGIETFAGSVFHSSSWNSAVDLRGKRVAVIGTGASAVQIIPSIVDTVSHLLVFQRSPAWILPRSERKISAFERWLFRHVPVTQKLMRVGNFWLLETIGLALFGKSAIHKLMTTIARGKLRREILDPVLREKLTPRYKFGCKRVVVSDDFYPAMNRPNVNLVTENIAEITASGIRTVDGRVHEADHIIFATGFVIADTDNYLQVVGRDGRVLKEDWDRTPEAFLGINVSGYPNLALLLGPNSGLGHSSVIHVMESQMKYVMQYVAKLDESGWTCTLDVKPDVQSRYNIDIQAKSRNSVWASGCNSWYLNRHGRNTTLFPGLAAQFRRLAARFNADDYVIRTGSWRS